MAYIESSSQTPRTEWSNTQASAMDKELAQVLSTAIHSHRKSVFRQYAACFCPSAAAVAQAFIDNGGLLIPAAESAEMFRKKRRPASLGHRSPLFIAADPHAAQPSRLVSAPAL